MNSGRAPRVLVVDDEPSVLETIAPILTEDGYQVATARGVDDALAHLRAQPFDVALVDLRLEGASGLSLLAELRRQWPETLAIVLTGYAWLESAVEALREGVYDHLLKPCTVPELKATVARAIERGALARALQERLAELDAANAQLRALTETLQQRVDEATRELRQKVEELSEARRRLEEAQRQREEFISLVAHELGGPLTAIGGYSQLLGRPGLLAQDRERARQTIFEPYVRLRSDAVQGQPKGAGLGLYVARGIVEAHGGWIRAESAGPDQGTTFSFTLPLAPG